MNIINGIFVKRMLFWFKFSVSELNVQFFRIVILILLYAVYQI